MVSKKQKLHEEYKKNPTFENWMKYKNCKEDIVEEPKKPIPKTVATANPISKDAEDEKADEK